MADVAYEDVAAQALALQLEDVLAAAAYEDVKAQAIALQQETALAFASYEDMTLPVQRRFVMSGMDAVLTTRDTWTVGNVPDFTGAHYAGALATPLRDIIVLDPNPRC